MKVCQLYILNVFSKLTCILDLFYLSDLENRNPLFMWFTASQVVSFQTYFVRFFHLLFSFSWKTEKRKKTKRYKREERWHHRVKFCDRSALMLHALSLPKVLVKRTDPPYIMRGLSRDLPSGTRAHRNMAEIFSRLVLPVVAVVGWRCFLRLTFPPVASPPSSERFCRSLLRSCALNVLICFHFVKGVPHCTLPTISCFCVAGKTL